MHYITLYYTHKLMEPRFAQLLDVSPPPSALPIWMDPTENITCGYTCCFTGPIRDLTTCRRLFLCAKTTHSVEHLIVPTTSMAWNIRGELALTDVSITGLSPFASIMVDGANLRATAGGKFHTSVLTQALCLRTGSNKVHITAYRTRFCHCCSIKLAKKYKINAASSTLVDLDYATDTRSTLDAETMRLDFLKLATHPIPFIRALSETNKIL